VLPVERPPLPNGAILIGADGRIAAVGPDTAVPSPPAVPAVHLEGAALLPGLVNAHTHLELTGLAGSVTETEFPAWIQTLRAVKAERAPGAYLAAAREGVARCFAKGVTTVADTGDSGAVMEALHEVGGSGVVYQEVFGPHPVRLEESVKALLDRVESLQRLVTDRLRLGVSPHAPYTVSGPLYRAVADFARRRRLPLAVHLAESQAEVELITAERGPFADAWRARRIPLPRHPAHDPPRASSPSPVEWLDWFGVLGPRTLGIHLVQVSERDVEILRARGVAVAHCPGSNRRHGHGDAPLRAMLAAGLAVGVGTDSEVSGGDLDLFAEARAARVLAGLDAGATLRLITADAARAIGVGDVGALAAGAWGDVVALRIEGADSPPAVEEAVLEAGHGGVVAVWRAGEP
jgi:5-methylthioadenosine/S-adenosylhomocysteine deaminase